MNTDRLSLGLVFLSRERTILLIMNTRLLSCFPILYYPTLVTQKSNSAHRPTHAGHVQVSLFLFLLWTIN